MNKITLPPKKIKDDGECYPPSTVEGTLKAAKILIEGMPGIVGLPLGGQGLPRYQPGDIVKINCPASNGGSPWNDHTGYITKRLPDGFFGISYEIKIIDSPGGVAAEWEQDLTLVERPPNLSPPRHDAPVYVDPKVCPFCGDTPETMEDNRKKKYIRCRAHTGWFTLEQWNTRNEDRIACPQCHNAPEGAIWNCEVCDNVGTIQRPDPAELIAVLIKVDDLLHDIAGNFMANQYHNEPIEYLCDCINKMGPLMSHVTGLTNPYRKP